MTEEPESRQPAVRSAVPLILLFAAAKVLFHWLTNEGYGFHRDELATIDDAKNLAWGYVAYPPVTPLLGRIAMLFGDITPSTLRFLPSVAQSLVILLAALMTRQFGGGRRAQWIAAGHRDRSGVSGCERALSVRFVRLPLVGPDRVSDRETRLVT